MNSCKRQSLQRNKTTSSNSQLEHPPLPLLAGVEGKLHLVSVGHTSMDTEMEQPLQGSIEEEPHIGNGSIVENPASDLVKSESDRIKTFYQTVLSAIMVFITAALSSYKDMKPLYSTTNHSKVWPAEPCLVLGSHHPRRGHRCDANRG